MSRCSLRFPRCSSLLLILGTLTLAAQTAAPNLNDPAAFLAAARATNGLSGDDLKPWHLKAYYDLFDDNGKPLGKGVFEEWWVAKDNWKQSYSGSHYSGTIYRSPEGFATDGSVLRWPESLIASSLISPIEEKFSGRLRPMPPVLSGEKPPLLCLPVSSEDRAPGKPPYNYCFDAGTTNLRVRKALFANTVYPRAGRFQGRNVGLEIVIQVNHQILASVHLVSLSTLPGESSDLIVPKPGLALRVVSDSAKASMTPPILLSSKDPILPDGFSKEDGEGAVNVRISVDKDGRVGDAHTLEAPNEALAKIAKDAVLKWRFKPAFQSGVPIAVDINIEVNFR